MNNFITELSEFHGQQYKPKRAFVKSLETMDNGVIIAKICVPIPTKNYKCFNYTLYCDRKSCVDEAVEQENKGIERLEKEIQTSIKGDQ